MSNTKKTKEKRNVLVELLAPAGSMQTLTAVIKAGADAVYAGGNQFGARAYAANFTLAELIDAILYLHLLDKRFYLTVNTLLKEKELTHELYHMIAPLYEAGLDGVIVQDMGVLSFVRENFPDLPIHASTQMNITSSFGAKLLKDCGCTRVVTARELSLSEIKTIHETVDIEIESFVHGALCYCYSGQCLFSSLLGGRSGNRGRCAQPCRLPYQLPPHKSSYLLSPKDLCTIGLLPQIIKSGVSSLKIEGRMKQTEYAAGVTAIYREYIDRYLEHPQAAYQVSPSDLEELENLGSRSGFTEGYYQKRNGADMVSFAKPSHTKKTAVKTDSFLAKANKKDVKRNLKGFLILSKESPAQFMLQCDEDKIVVTGEVVQAANQQRLTRGVVEEKIAQMGTSPFQLEELIIQMDEDAFYPLSSLKKLRRQGIEAMTLLIQRKFNRRLTEREQASFGTANKVTQSTIAAPTPWISAAIEALDQLPPVLEHENISRIYVDLALFSKRSFSEQIEKLITTIKTSGKEAFLSLPPVMRQNTTQWLTEKKNFLATLPLDGFLVKSYDGLGFVKDTTFNKFTIITDSSVYTWNHDAFEELKKLGVTETTLPLELNQRELMYRGYGSGEMIVYGHIPLMQSSQCLLKNTSGCSANGRPLKLIDRYLHEFPVKTYCEHCYNTIYNGFPLSLLHLLEQIYELSPSGLRLSFTIESPQQVQNILKTLASPQKIDNLTNGHFKRGVE